MSIPAWFAKKNLFITGGTGFLGICLIEKLLRAVPDGGDIYVLIRPKRGADIAQRVSDLKASAIFDRMRSEGTLDAAYSRIIPIAGDVSQPELGISPIDRATLVEHVNVMVHSAATLDFTDPLKITVNVNLLGTRRCLELAKDCRSLQAFVYVSSAYANAWRLDVEEIVYPLEQDAELIVKLVDSLSDEELEARTPELLGKHPNPYTLTKHMSEHEVQQCEALFPCAIVRPSMITASWHEPCPGWTNSKNGPQGFIMGASRGVLRRLPVSKEIVYDYIPVDLVVNELLAAAFHVGMTQRKTVEVYHSTSSTSNPFHWSAVEGKMNKVLHEFPLMNAVWYPHLKLLTSTAHFKLAALFFHIIPAFFLDLITRICGGRPILMKLHRNVNASLDRLQVFIFTEWKFDNSKTKELQQWLSTSDQIAFNLDVSELQWGDYFEEMTKGVRQYLSRESPKNINAARSKDKLLMVLHYGFQVGFYGILWYLISCCTGCSMIATSVVVPLAYVLFSFL